MGVNLVTLVRNFRISTETFSSGDHDVQDGCVTPGQHRVMRFDFLSYNAGNSDMVIGSPASRPDLFVWSSGHGHYHLKDFNQFLLFSSAGALATVGYKQAFCAIDIERIRPSAGAARFSDCNSDQGISAGWADVYSSGLACQFIVIDGVPDGDYTLQSTTNSQHVAHEDCFGDNVTWTGLRIQGSSVTVIDAPWIPEDRIPFSPNAVSAVEIGGRWKVVEGNHWMLDTGSDRSAAERAVQIIKHYGLSFMCFVGRPRCGDVEPMMYFLTGSGAAPSGSLTGEDVIPFNTSALRILQVGDRWKVVEGTHWLLDFGAGEANARAALHFIKKHAFNQMCFVGRPHPPMTYFKRADRITEHRHFVDPRWLDFRVDPPRWSAEQSAVLAERTPSLDFTRWAADPAGFAKAEKEIRFRAPGVEKREHGLGLVTRHGVLGAPCGKEAEVVLQFSASIIDVEIAHFGQPPHVDVFDGHGRRICELTADRVPRQVERLRAVGEDLRRVVIRSDDAETLLVSVRTVRTVTPSKKAPLGSPSEAPPGSSE